MGPSHLLPAQPEVPSSKYYTLRYVLAATLAVGESRIILPAFSDDSDALFCGCRMLGAELHWEDEQEQVLVIRGVERPTSSGPLTINVGNAGAVARLLLGLGALLPEVTFVTDHPESLGKRPNRELLEALTSLGVICEGTGPEGCLPITLRRNELHGGHVTISGARSSQYLSALLFLAPLLPEGLEIDVVDGLKSQPLVRATLEVLQEAGIVVSHDAALLHFHIAPGQRYQPRTYRIPGDYPSAAALLAAYAVSNDPSSILHLDRLRPGDEVGDVLLQTFKDMGADMQIAGENVTLRGGRRLQGFELDGDPVIDCIPVLVAAACFAEGESIISNIESLHYKESDRINDLCSELRRAGCNVEPQSDAIIIHGQPQGVEGGVTVDGHSDHRLLMALAIVALRSHRGLTLTGAEHISKSYPHFFTELQSFGATIRTIV
ncbi:3-phosphoshikimate 1-carboxyvinyltransferase [Dictyobacter arantiisoli]|uniref:3-phosphoshikimate 1-carboxyvinyltransferase n=1 Tax=Dictyobacter arantiisoli TaxID=2014874 RepID=UPI001C0F0617|nr:3-phosphoshikimate 1-carboxyvinyltransferase [Dictyobacter arantiisoli]